MENRNGKLESIRENVKGFVDQSADKAEAIRNRAMDVKKQAFDRGGEVVDRASEFIKDNPLKAVAIAFGVGYIGMRLFRR